MVDPTTVNVALAIPTRGSDVGTWDTPVNGDFNSLDGFLGGVQTISASNANIVLTAPAGSITPSGGPTQAQNAVVRITGVLTGAVQVTLPLPGYMILENLTTGAFVLSFRAIGSGQVVAVEQGSVQHVYNDGTNVRFVNLPPVSSLLDLVTTIVPAWINACTVPPYLNCDGTTFNATTYPYLNARLGGNRLPDLRGVARYTLNQGTGRITTSGSGLDGNTLLANQFGQITTLLTANLPPFTPTGTITVNTLGLKTRSGNALISNDPTSLFEGNSADTLSNPNNGPFASASITFAGVAQGGVSTPFGKVGPGTVAGITLIRAA